MEQMERAGHARVHVPTLSRYIQQHVLGRCGQAVTRLVESGLVEWPAFSGDDTDICEWWLVSDELADRLREAHLPVLRFGELNMWGRTSVGTDMSEDLELVGAVRG